MNKIQKFAVALGSVFCLLLPGSNAFPQAYSQVFPNEMMGAAVYESTGSNRFEASWLIGRHVRTPEGGDLGQISSLVIDRTNGRVALVVLSDVPTLGGEVLAIPFSSITRTGHQTFEFNPGSMEIEVASGYWDSYVYTVTQYWGTSYYYGLPSEIDHAWVAEIYRHYGQIPYWTEGGEQSSMAIEFYESTELMGAEARLPNGESVGQINDLIIDSADGHVSFLVLSDVSGRGDALRLRQALMSLQI
jgi:sporulation protein YlmC with PRC-barrel domain